MCAWAGGMCARTRACVRGQIANLLPPKPQDTTPDHKHKDTHVRPPCAHRHTQRGGRDRYRKTYILKRTYMHAVHTHRQTDGHTAEMCTHTHCIIGTAIGTDIGTATAPARKRAPIPKQCSVTYKATSTLCIFRRTCIIWRLRMTPAAPPSLTLFRCPPFSP